MAKRTRAKRLEQKIIKKAKGLGLERLMSDGIYKLINKHDKSSGEVVCGYSCQPMYVNEHQNYVLSGCVLDKKRQCEYNIPSDGQIYENCEVYKKAMK